MSSPAKSKRQDLTPVLRLDPGASDRWWARFGWLIDTDAVDAGAVGEVVPFPGYPAIIECGTRNFSGTTGEGRPGRSGQGSERIPSRRNFTVVHDRRISEGTA